MLAIRGQKLTNDEEMNGDLLCVRRNSFSVSLRCPQLMLWTALPPPRKCH